MNQALVHVGRSGANIFTIRNSSCGKVMFSHLSVSHSVHMAGGACMARGGGHAWQERRPLQWTVCILLECILVYFMSV